MNWLPELPPLPPVAEIKSAGLEIVLPALLSVLAIVAMWRHFGATLAYFLGPAISTFAALSYVNALHPLVLWWPGAARGYSWVPVCALLAGLVEALVRGLKWPFGLAWLSRLAVIGIAVWLTFPPVLWGQIEVDGETVAVVPWLLLLLLGTGFLVQWVSAIWISANYGWLGPLAWTGTAWATMVLLLYAHSARFMELLLLIMVILGVLTCFCALRWVDASVSAVLGVISVTAMQWNGPVSTFSAVPWVAFLFVALAPLSLWFGLLSSRYLFRAWPAQQVAGAAGVVGYLVLLAAALFLAMKYEKLDFGT